MADQNNGKLDRVIPTITLKPEKQLEYFMESNEGKRLTTEEIDVIRKMIEDKEIQIQGLMTIDPDEYNNEEFTDEYDEKSGLPFIKI